MSVYVKKKVRHFPELISFDTKKCKFKLSNCGYDFRYYNHKIKNKINSIKIENAEQQIDCIIHNLKKII